MKKFNISGKGKNRQPLTTTVEMAEYFGVSRNLMKGRVSRSSDSPVPEFPYKTSLNLRYYNKKEFIDWYKRNYLNDGIEKT